MLFRQGHINSREESAAVFAENPRVFMEVSIGVKRDHDRATDQVLQQGVVGAASGAGNRCPRPLHLRGLALNAGAACNGDGGISNGVLQGVEPVAR